MAGFLAFWLAAIVGTFISVVITGSNDFRVFVSSILIGVFYPSLYSRYKLKKNLRKNRQRMIEIENLVGEKMGLLKSFSEVPEDYWYCYAVDQLISYFNNKRADTLKEAINLLESDIKHAQQMGQLQTLNVQAYHIKIFSAVSAAASVANSSRKRSS